MVWIWTIGAFGAFVSFLMTYKGVSNRTGEMMGWATAFLLFLSLIGKELQ